MLLQTLGTSMMGNILTGKCVIRAGKDVVKTGRRNNNIGKNFWFLSIV